MTGTHAPDVLIQIATDTSVLARVFMRPRMQLWRGTGKKNRGTANAAYTTEEPRLRLCPLGNCATIPHMLEMVAGCGKWAGVGFVVAYFLMKLYEASHIHDDIPKPEFKIRQSRRAALVLSSFAGMLSGLVWLLVQNWD
jgi:hypothetical protein